MLCGRLQGLEHVRGTHSPSLECSHTPGHKSAVSNQRWTQGSIISMDRDDWRSVIDRASDYCGVQVADRYSARQRWAQYNLCRVSGGQRAQDR
jgi:hypothetical protein